MKFSNLAIALLALGSVACGKSGSESGDSSSNSAAVEENFDAENFSSTIDSDNAVMNESDLEHLNSSGG